MWRIVLGWMSEGQSIYRLMMGLGLGSRSGWHRGARLAGVNFLTGL
jgi:hypothetical protein